jgi:hypothetical protein
MELQDLTMGEIEEIEEIAQDSISNALSSDGANRTKALIGIAWVVKRKSDPGFTLDKARGLTMREINDLLEGLTDPKETGA